MRKIQSYILGSIDEVLNKTSWVDYAELQKNAILVLVASLIFAVLIGLVDMGFKNILDFFYREF